MTSTRGTQIAFFFRFLRTLRLVFTLRLLMTRRFTLLFTVRRRFEGIRFAAGRWAGFVDVSLDACLRAFGCVLGGIVRTDVFVVFAPVSVACFASSAKLNGIAQTNAHTNTHRKTDMFLCAAGVMLAT
tara:strand:+ start:17142 stop:17525 length:384 start_codon:yes stop_codon:yes gene_type:complete